MLYPLTFRPIFKERVWGGRNLERLYAKPLPPTVPIGESWELSDRPGDVSVITNGPLAGKDLRWLMEQHSEELLGKARAMKGRFPLLIKLLDARETLSVQVHPPERQAERLGGEPKTELWHITNAVPGAKLYVGLRSGVTRAEFERRLRDGSVAECLHRIPVGKGDSMFLPSGRVHAIGADLVLFEIQQNSDTTYRVFDWNRKGLDGKPRELHVAESLASIDWEDFEPALIESRFTGKGFLKRRLLVSDPLFVVSSLQFTGRTRALLRRLTLQIIGCVKGRVEVEACGQGVMLSAGQFALVPASAPQAEVRAATAAECLWIIVGR